MGVTIYALDDDEPEIDELAYVAPDAVVIGRVKLGPQASVWPCAVLRGDHGTITIGARTSVQDGTVVHTTARFPTVIGDDCVVGHNAHLEGCVVESGCLIGSGSVTLNARSWARSRSSLPGPWCRRGSLCLPGLWWLVCLRRSSGPTWTRRGPRSRSRPTSRAPVTTGAGCAGSARRSIRPASRETDPPP